MIMASSRPPLHCALEEHIMRAETLIQRCYAHSEIGGAAKMARKIQTELKFLNKLRKKDEKAIEVHLQSYNLTHLQAVVEHMETLPEVVQVQKRFQPISDEQTTLETDVICHGGATWVKVIARKGEALHRVYEGGGEYGEKCIVTQARTNRKFAEHYKHHFRPPSLLFIFCQGISREMKQALEAEHVCVKGEVIDVATRIPENLVNCDVITNDDVIERHKQWGTEPSDNTGFSFLRILHLDSDSESNSSDDNDEEIQSATELLKRQKGRHDLQIYIREKEARYEHRQQFLKETKEIDRSDEKAGFDYRHEKSEDGNVIERTVEEFAPENCDKHKWIQKGKELDRKIEEEAIFGHTVLKGRTKIERKTEDFSQENCDRHQSVICKERHICETCHVCIKTHDLSRDGNKYSALKASQTAASIDQSALCSCEFVTTQNKSQIPEHCKLSAQLESNLRIKCPKNRTETSGNLTDSGTVFNDFNPSGKITNYNTIESRTEMNQGPTEIGGVFSDSIFISKETTSNTDMNSSPIIGDFHQATDRNNCNSLQSKSDINPVPEEFGTIFSESSQSTHKNTSDFHSKHPKTDLNPAQNEFETVFTNLHPQTGINHSDSNPVFTEFGKVFTNLHPPTDINITCVNPTPNDFGTGFNDFPVPPTGINRLNLDITTLIAYVSNLCHGFHNYEFKEPVLRTQAIEERKEAVLPILDKWFQGKELYVCQTAYDSFLDILHTVGGPSECTRAKELLARVKVVADSPSERVTSLPSSAKVKERAKVIFGTGESVQAITVTANIGFVRASEQRGLTLPVLVHPARALTEQKQPGYKRAT